MKNEMKIKMTCMKFWQKAQDRQVDDWTAYKLSPHWPRGILRSWVRYLRPITKEQ